MALIAALLFALAGVVGSGFSRRPALGAPSHARWATAWLGRLGRAVVVWSLAIGGLLCSASASGSRQSTETSALLLVVGWAVALGVFLISKPIVDSATRGYRLGARTRVAAIREGVEFRWRRLRRTFIVLDRADVSRRRISVSIDGLAAFAAAGWVPMLAIALPVVVLAAGLVLVGAGMGWGPSPWSELFQIGGYAFILPCIVVAAVAGLVLIALTWPTTSVREVLRRVGATAGAWGIVTLVFMSTVSTLSAAVSQFVALPSPPSGLTAAGITGVVGAAVTIGTAVGLARGAWDALRAVASRVAASLIYASVWSACGLLVSLVANPQLLFRWLIDVRRAATVTLSADVRTWSQRDEVDVASMLPNAPTFAGLAVAFACGVGAAAMLARLVRLRVGTAASLPPATSVLDRLTAPLGFTATRTWRVDREVACSVDRASHLPCSRSARTL